MCIVIDTNTIARVFNPSNKEHAKFKPVLDWLIDGRGRLVLGGSKYLTELSRCKKYLGIINELKRKRVTIFIDRDSVDKEEKRLKSDVRRGSFNDHHIIAIVIVSRCRLVCSADQSSFKVISDQSYYPKGCKKPKIYSGSKSCKNLISNEYLRPCERLK